MFMYDSMYSLRDPVSIGRVWLACSRAVECGFELRLGLTKVDYKIGICCFSVKRAALRSKSINWMTQNAG